MQLPLGSGPGVTGNFFAESRACGLTFCNYPLLHALMGYLRCLAEDLSCQEFQSCYKLHAVMLIRVPWQEPFLWALNFLDQGLNCFHWLLNLAVRLFYKWNMERNCISPCHLYCRVSRTVVWLSHFASLRKS